MKQLFFLMAFFLFLGFAIPHIVSAQVSDETLGLKTIESDVGLGKTDIRLIIANIIRTVLGLMGIIVLSLLIYAGYTIMTAAGNETKIEQGKKILINATVGLTIVLSSFAITQFIINQLAGATGFTGGGGGGAGGPPTIGTFAGSGSLGKVVRDHYPFRDQKNVARNTKITVTFNVPLNPASIFDNHNASVDGGGAAIYGDCDTAAVAFSWADDCDRIIPGVIVVTKVDADGIPVGSPLNMAAMGNYDGTEMKNIVLQPLDPLGNDTENVTYAVTLTGAMRRSDVAFSVFDRDLDGNVDAEYKWFFQTGTHFDYDPPTIISVYPSDGEAVARNTVIQINFSEAVDPMVTQGRAANLTHIIFGDATITGTWRISNAYRTVEFVSDQACGENSCGETMYCLPVGSKHVLARTAALVAPGNFEALPFSGITDMASNALDGDKDGVADGKPTLGVPVTSIGAEEADMPAVGLWTAKRDNYLWNFDVQNFIDKSAPYIMQVSPGIDRENVDADAEHYIHFSKKMWTQTFNGIKIEEFGVPADKQVDFWMRTWAEIVNVSETKVSISHRVFGPNNTDAYYFTSVAESVKSLNQNCVYPGYGPVDNTIVDVGASSVCSCTPNVNTGALTCNGHCVAVTGGDGGAEDTGCVELSGGDLLKKDVDECLVKMRDISHTIN